MATEREWQDDHDEFVKRDTEHRAAGQQDYPGGDTVAAGRTVDGPLAEQFVALAQDLFAVPPEAGVIGVLDRVVHHGAALVPAADVVSVTLRQHDGAFLTPAETDPLANLADQVQYEYGEGPCVEATATPGLGLTASSNLADDPQYPRFGPRAAELGFAALFATGLFPGGNPPRLGALNYYSYTAGALDELDRDIALILAAHAAVALHAARTLETEQLKNAQLTEGLQSRDVIGQAKGILMERRGCDAGQAFDILRRASQDLNVKLRDVAATVAERRAEL